MSEENTTTDEMNQQQADEVAPKEIPADEQENTDKFYDKTRKQQCFWGHMTKYKFMCLLNLVILAVGCAILIPLSFYVFTPLIAQNMVDKSEMSSENTNIVNWGVADGSVELELNTYFAGVFCDIYRDVYHNGVMPDNEDCNIDNYLDIGDMTLFNIAMKAVAIPGPIADFLAGQMAALSILFAPLRSVRDDYLNVTSCSYFNPVFVGMVQDVLIANLPHIANGDMLTSPMSVSYDDVPFAKLSLPILNINDYKGLSDSRYAPNTTATLAVSDRHQFLLANVDLLPLGFTTGNTTWGQLGSIAQIMKILGSEFNYVLSADLLILITDVYFRIGPFSVGSPLSPIPIERPKDFFFCVVGDLLSADHDDDEHLLAKVMKIAKPAIDELRACTTPDCYLAFTETRRKAIHDLVKHFILDNPSAEAQVLRRFINAFFPKTPLPVQRPNDQAPEQHAAHPMTTDPSAPRAGSWDDYIACDISTNANACNLAAISRTTMANKLGYKLYSDKVNTECIDGSQHITQIIPGDGTNKNNVLVFFQGGGACWQNILDEMDAKFCTQMSSPDTEGVLDYKNPNNPFYNWTIVHITYCSGDAFLGTGASQTTSMQKAKGSFHVKQAVDWLALQPELKTATSKVVVSGCSAGALGAQVWYPFVQNALTTTDDRFLLLADSYLGVFPETRVLASSSVAISPDFCNQQSGVTGRGLRCVASSVATNAVVLDSTVGSIILRDWVACPVIEEIFGVALLSDSPIISKCYQGGVIGYDIVKALHEKSGVNIAYINSRNDAVQRGFYAGLRALNAANVGAETTASVSQLLPGTTCANAVPFNECNTPDYSTSVAYDSFGLSEPSVHKRINIPPFLGLPIEAINVPASSLVNMLTKLASDPLSFNTGFEHIFANILNAIEDMYVQSTAYWTTGKTILNSYDVTKYFYIHDSAQHCFLPMDKFYEFTQNENDASISLVSWIKTLPVVGSNKPTNVCSGDCPK